MNPAAHDGARSAGALLSLRAVSKRFGGVVAADGCSLDVGAGEVLGVIGPNGAGKSTMLRMIAGEQRPDSGEVWFDGLRLDRLPQHRVAHAGVALAHQTPKPFRGLTVRQNVQVGALAGEKRRRKGVAEHVDGVLEATGLAAKADTPAARLGLLDLKRLELARALSTAPRVLLLDEVGAGLVHAELQTMIELVARVRHAGTTLIVVEHVESVIRELAARVVVLDWGRIVATGTPEAIAADPQVRALYLGTATRADGDADASRPARVRRPMGADLLRLHGVSAHYGGARALHRVDLHVKSGEVVAVFGANGAGKTTLARVASGLVRPSAGRLSFDGRDIGALPAHERVALGIAHCHEGRKLFGELTVRENLDLGAYTPRARHGLAARRERVFELFPALRERQEQLAGTLSGGQQQMVAIGRALMSSPRLLILDEASLGLAPIVASQILGAVADIRDAGTAVLLVEQNVHRSLAVADRAYVLDHGAVSFEGSPAELRGEATLWKVYFGGVGEQRSQPQPAAVAH